MAVGSQTPSPPLAQRYPGSPSSEPAGYQWRAAAGVWGAVAEEEVNFNFMRDEEVVEDVLVFDPKEVIRDEEVVEVVLVFDPKEVIRDEEVVEDILVFDPKEEI